MEDPIREIPLAIRRCAGADTADEQIDAFHEYFTGDAEFLHPLVFVPSRPNSLHRVIGIYMFYRIAIPHTSFIIDSVAFDEANGKLYVDLHQLPWVRGLSLVLQGWRPALPMHVHFWLRKVGKKWYIRKQEDTIQLMSLMLALPPVGPLAYLLFWICEMGGLITAFVFVTLGFWRPRKYLSRKRKPRRTASAKHTRALYFDDGQHVSVYHHPLHSAGANTE